jgi:hypothetical protein
MMGVLTGSRNKLLGVSLGTLLGGLLIAGLLGKSAMPTPWSLVGAFKGPQGGPAQHRLSGQDHASRRTHAKCP